MSSVFVRQTLGMSIIAAVILAISVPVSSVNAGMWTVTNLHPAGSLESHANGVGGAQQVGTALVGGQRRASLWNGTAASWVDLNPAGATWSEAYGVSDGQQVGYVSTAAGFYASLWSGSAASLVNLHPAGGFAHSWANDVSADQQVGDVCVDFLYCFASLWSGTAASWVNLHPAGGKRSSALGVSADQQVGFTIDGADFPHASLWSGTAASWVDLYPGFTESYAYGVGGGQQVGSVYTTPGIPHASLWSGTAASWVDLHPAGADQSRANGVSDGQQVGYVATLNVGESRASLWSGTAASWVDLHAFLPPGFSSSQAQSIWSDANFTYVAGYGVNSATGYKEALLWTHPIPEPGAAALLVLCGLLATAKIRIGLTA